MNEIEKLIEFMENSIVLNRTEGIMRILPIATPDVYGI